MPGDDDFLPYLGRQRARGGKPSARGALGAILAAANLARGGIPAKVRRGFTGSRIGRGCGMGQALAARGSLAAFRARRVIVKARIVRLAGKGLAAAKAHLRYVERDGTSRSGERGTLYAADTDAADRGAFLSRSEPDRHQFRFIVSPEEGTDYADFKDLTRRLMAQVADDLRTRLDWVAIDHFDTAHPHVHIIVRGRDERGKDLVIASDYIAHGMRQRAAELVDLDLGPRSDEAIRKGLLSEVEQERLTSLDRGLMRDANSAGTVSPKAGDPRLQSLRIGRLRHLERLGLAEREGAAWRLSPDLESNLRQMGERGDIIRAMQRAHGQRGEVMPAARSWSVYQPGAPGCAPVIGRLVERGLADELDDRHYLIVAATDGRTYYADIGKGASLEALPHGAVVRLTPRAAEPRAADRTIAEVAAVRDGRYSADLHLAHDPGASEAYVAAHVRRLEAMRRALGTITRDSEGTWHLGSAHLAVAARYEALRARDNPVTVETLSSLPLARLVDAEAATWLDRDLISARPIERAAGGFGRELEDALEARRRWLVAEGLASQAGDRTTYVPDLIERLRRRELLRVAGQLSAELGLRFAESSAGERIEGTYRRAVDLVSGRFALIETSREFTLVPWRPALDGRAGTVVSGIVRESGVSWTIGRPRSGPSL